jgi:hypothetical protein
MVVPIAPLLVFYFFKGLKEFSVSSFKIFTPLVYRTLILLWIGLSILGSIDILSSRESPQNLGFSPEGLPYRSMTSHIKQELPHSARIAYIKPRYLSLYTDHQTVIPPFLGPPSYTGPALEIITYLSDWQVAYVLLDDHFRNEEKALRDTMAHFPDRFSLSFASPPLFLYRFFSPG